MSKSKKQLWLERELEKEKLRQLEKEVKSCAKNYKKSLEKKATSAEKRMWYALKASPLAKVYEGTEPIIKRLIAECNKR